MFSSTISSSRSPARIAGLWIVWHGRRRRQLYALLNACELSCFDQTANRFRSILYPGSTDVRHRQRTIGQDLGYVPTEGGMHNEHEATQP